MMAGAMVTFGAWEANITLELPLMIAMVLIGIFLIWLIQKFTGGFDKRGD